MRIYKQALQMIFFSICRITILKAKTRDNYKPYWQVKLVVKKETIYIVYSEKNVSSEISKMFETSAKLLKNVSQKPFARVKMRIWAFLRSCCIIIFLPRTRNISVYRGKLQEDTIYFKLVEEIFFLTETHEQYVSMRFSFTMNLNIENA